MPIFVALASLIFQSTLPREERRSLTTCLQNTQAFQSTLPREERPSLSQVVCCAYKFQSTLPREERLCVHLLFVFLIYISIHAPTRGATLVTHCVLLHDIIFQSTLPREERQISYFQHSLLIHISIHAPTRGATLYFTRHLFVKLYFNPRSHERSDIRYADDIVAFGNFNPRSHERSDPIFPT